ncbi:hypothetical protein JW752_03600 [Candidatus Peregrinibacteria bacterium]|nr:hypothetical protein [Candidatus Peregrinibacteria bacterium]
MDKIQQNRPGNSASVPAEMPDFKLNPEIVQDILADAKEYEQELSDANTPEEEKVECAGLYLECLAALSAAKESLPETKLELSESLIQKVIGMLSAEVLTDEADRVIEIINRTIDNCHDDEDDELLVSQLDIEHHLQYRHRFMTRMEGARLVLGDKAPDYSDEQKDAVLYFDGLIRPIVWGMSFANSRRSGHAMMIHPENRKDYWWWCEGCNIFWGDIQTAGEVAELMERYETFRTFVERFRRTARIMLGKAKPEDVKPRRSEEEIIAAVLEQAKAKEPEQE